MLDGLGGMVFKYDMKLCHFHYDEVLQLERVTEGMEIKGKIVRTNVNCEICMKREFCSEQEHRACWKRTCIT